MLEKGTYRLMWQMLKTDQEYDTASVFDPTLLYEAGRKRMGYIVKV